jgi:hypothetical protein
MIQAAPALLTNLLLIRSEVDTSLGAGNWGDLGAGGRSGGVMEWT